MKGGVLFQKGVILPELIRFSNANVTILQTRFDCVLFKLTLPEVSSVITSTCGVKTILVKVVTFKRMGNVHPVTIDQFEEEVHLHQEASTKSVEKFDCMILPSLLYASIVNEEECQVFTEIYKRLAFMGFQHGSVGLIFMEQITKDGDIAPYAKTEKLYPKARRLLIMFTQLGFHHNDFHVGNILETENTLVLIDFGRATRLTDEELDYFNALVTHYDATKDSTTKEAMITFMYNRHYEHVNDKVYHWLKGGVRYDPTIEIDTQESIVAPIRLQERNCVSFPKIPYREIEKIRHDGSALRDSAHTNDKKIVLLAVKQNGMALQYASKALQEDKEVVTAAVKQNGLALQYASRDLQQDKEVVIAAVKQNGWVLRLAKELQRDKEVVIAAVKQNGLALQYASRDLQHDKEVVIDAINSNGKCIEFLSPEILVEIAFYAFKENENLIHIPRTLRDNTAFMQEIVKVNGFALRYADALKADRDAVLHAVKQNGLALQFASKDLRMDEDIVLAALEKNGTAIQYTTLRTPTILMTAALKGYTPTHHEFDTLIPYIDQSEPKRQKTILHDFKLKFKDEIKDAVDRMYHREQHMNESVERLATCKEPRCSISGGTRKRRRRKYNTKRT